MTEIKRSNKEFSAPDVFSNKINFDTAMKLSAFIWPKSGRL